LKESVNSLEESKQQMDVGYIGIGMGLIAIVIAITSLVKSKKN
jgi:hypothetical protein